MKLVKLSANKESFRTVNFRPSGLSLIVAEKSIPDEKGGRRTFNGVGKSLAGYFVNFCLGSKFDPKLKTLLPDWVFSLNFVHEGKDYQVDRSIESGGSEVLLNGVPLTLAAFNTEMGKFCFSLTGSESFLTFRVLIKRFLRCGKRSYMSFDQFDADEEDFQALLANSQLFGLSTDLIIRKYKLRKDQQTTKDLSNRLESDEVFKKFFSANSDGKIQRKDLEDKIKRAENELAEFKIAENYSEIKTQVAQIKRSLRDYTDELSNISGRLRVIDNNLKLGADLERTQLVTLYEEANIVFRDGVKRSLEELEQFNQSMLKDRARRMQGERAQLIARWTELNRERRELDTSLARNLKYLDTHGELEEYSTMNRKLSGLNFELQKIKDYQEILESYKEKLSAIKVEQAKQTIETADYLKAKAADLERILELFRSYSSRFYDDKPGGVTVVNNEGANLNRFKIDCKIEDDSASGINQVKIFCYDLMILMLRQNHGIEFVFHDSQLFSNMDARQRSIAFQVAQEVADSMGIQYIASLNQDALDSIKNELGEEGFSTVFKGSRILTLTDKSHADKLLGVHIDFDYDP